MGFERKIWVCVTEKKYKIILKPNISEMIKNECIWAILTDSQPFNLTSSIIDDDNLTETNIWKQCIWNKLFRSLKSIRNSLEISSHVIWWDSHDE